MDAIPKDFVDGGERAAERRFEDSVALLRHLQRIGEEPTLYWSRTGDGEHYVHGYSLTLLYDGGVAFGLGVLEDDVSRASEWLARRIAPDGLIVALVEQPPPLSYAEFEALSSR